MGVADAVAIAQVVAPSAVALAAIGFASRQQIRAYRLDRHLADRAELRELLDASARSLTKVRGYAGSLAGKFVIHGRNLPTEAAPTIEHFKEVGREIELHQDQLSIRLGTDAGIVRIHGEAYDSAVTVLTTLDSLSAAGNEPLRPFGTVLERNRILIDDARDAFVEAAVEIIGVEPSPVARRSRVRLVRGH
jgi:hypothetical protein